MSGRRPLIKGMKKISYDRYRIPPEIAAATQDAALYHRDPK
jgi:hypothetical protein